MKLVKKRLLAVLLQQLIGAEGSTKWLLLNCHANKIYLQIILNCNCWQIKRLTKNEYTTRLEIIIHDILVDWDVMVADALQWNIG